MMFSVRLVVVGVFGAKRGRPSSFLRFRMLSIRLWSCGRWAARSWEQTMTVDRALIPDWVATLPADGEYDVLVGSLGDRGGGSYTVSVGLAEATLPEEVASFAVGSMEIGESVDGVLGGDRGVWRFLGWSREDGRRVGGFGCVRYGFGAAIDGRGGTGMGR